ncbi:MAG: hypothetical protein WBN70_12435, partial [Polyangiales bacterium]
SEVECGSLAPDTCLNVSEDGFFAPGWRSIIGSRGDTACNGDVLVVECEAVERPDGRTFISLDANIGDEFAFQLDAILGDGSVEDVCDVTIIEDQAPYDFGVCGIDPPSMEQPCQLSNVSTANNEVVFDLECQGLLSMTSGLGFDVGAVGGGPTTIRFSNCTGF